MALLRPSGHGKDTRRHEDGPALATTVAGGRRLAAAEPALPVAPGHSGGRAGPWGPHRPLSCAPPPEDPLTCSVVELKRFG
jgi:hypothetical protein